MEKPIAPNFDVRPAALPDVLQHDAPSVQSPQQAAPPAAAAVAAKAPAPTSSIAQSTGRSMGAAFANLIGQSDFNRTQSMRDAIDAGRLHAKERDAREQDLLSDPDYLAAWYDQGIAAQNRIMRQRDSGTKQRGDK